MLGVEGGDRQLRNMGAHSGVMKFLYHDCGNCSMTLYTGQNTTVQLIGEFYCIFKLIFKSKKTKIF